MKERPILYSAPMVRARNDGRKRMTRRIIKVQPPESCVSFDFDPDSGLWLGDSAEAIDTGSESVWQSLCPYGMPGDRLWGRETYALLTDPGALTTWDLQIPDSLPSATNTQLGHIPTPIYRADGERPDVSAGNQRGPMRWRPGIHMPRWASRMLDEITAVKVERVQDISDADIIAEGVTVPMVAALTGIPWSEISTLFDAWRLLWIAINSLDSWMRNDWCWVIAFKPVSP